MRIKETLSLLDIDACSFDSNMLFLLRSSAVLNCSEITAENCKLR